jgi:hypothetical protein
MLRLIESKPLPGSEPALFETFEDFKRLPIISEIVSNKMIFTGFHMENDDSGKWLLLVKATGGKYILIGHIEGMIGLQMINDIEGM